MVFTNLYINPYYFIIPLIAGFILDSILGDPLWLPHPIRLFGNLITLIEKKLNSKNYKKPKGVISVILLAAFVFSILFITEKVIIQYQYIYYCFTTIMIFYGIANKNLITETLKVEKKLSNEGIEAGRKQLSFIVGRDTSELSENKIRIAVLETLAENLSDGVIAPLFYYAIGGIPLLFTYKIINTLDSMIGYKSEKYKDFGWFAAKLDDFANYIPARITAFLMVLITLSDKGFFFIFKYGNNHASPNAGYPEAALAGILNCRFGGPNMYHGQIIDKPYIGTNNRIVLRSDLFKACAINYITSLVFVGIIIFVALLVN